MFKFEGDVDSYVYKIRSFVLMAFSTYIIVWCSMRVVERSEILLSTIGSPSGSESVDLYKFIMFQAIPIGAGVCVAFLYRPKSIYIPSVFLMVAVGFFWFTAY